MLCFSVALHLAHCTTLIPVSLQVAGLLPSAFGTTFPFLKLCPKAGVSVTFLSSHLSHFVTSLPFSVQVGFLHSASNFLYCPCPKAGISCLSLSEQSLHLIYFSPASVQVGCLVLFLILH